MTHPTFAPRRTYGLLWAASITAIVLGDFLFFKRPVGCSIAIFAAFLLLCLGVRGLDATRRWQGRVLLLAMIGLIAALLIEPTTLNFTAALFALGCLAMFRRESTLLSWLESWVQLLALGWLRIVEDNRLVAGWIQRNPRGRIGKWNVGGWAIPVLLSAVFVALFAIANPIISNVMSSIESRLEWLMNQIPELLDYARIAFWIALAAGTWGLLRARLRRAAKPQALVAPIAMPDFFSAQSVARCLLLFNLVFAAETVLDIMYLWGGHTLPEGMTYKMYARRGAYPLVATALLAAIFVLVTFRSGRATERSTTCRRLVYLWCAQNVFLLISAAWRLKLYVDADNLTRLRVAAGLWMILVAAGFVWIGWRIINEKNNAWLLRINMLTAAVMLYICCFVNIDGHVARYNADHCREVGGEDWLDLDYMRVLGTDALPALAHVRHNLRPEKRAQADALMDQLHVELNNEISDWRGWTLRRQQLASEMKSSSPLYASGPKPVAVATASPASTR